MKWCFVDSSTSGIDSIWFYAYFTDSPDGICSYHLSLVSVVVHFPTLIQDMFDPAVFFLEQPTLAVLGGWLRGSIENLISSIILYLSSECFSAFPHIPGHMKLPKILRLVVGASLSSRPCVVPKIVLALPLGATPEAQLQCKPNHAEGDKA